MRSTFKKILTFISVAESGSFEAAARELHITSSAVAFRIKSLEDELKLKLLNRCRPCTLTLHGKIFYKHATKLCQCQQQFEQEILTN